MQNPVSRAAGDREAIWKNIFEVIPAVMCDSAYTSRQNAAPCNEKHYFAGQKNMSPLRRFYLL